ncbi:hypothetical protein BDV38DRAFT_254299 [Aspergillus pseudotamarii]|uniref:Uncharacterized protein n=1 Tax=Aspergillus pseudotamarii TaxID=132259 RepID=A0A5N6SJD3_ASPPS|nr:uncharacterized protein BDV38DRAFT_254299 [Aspergillus pseudotamarii]KAE8134808.1 hypothetical protein BDV38DRAFT_254299 [Aspergillus pseudotamarii]
MQGQNHGHAPEIVSWDRRDASGKVESSEERLHLDTHGHGHRDSEYRASVLKNLLKYGTTFHWDDENGSRLSTTCDISCGRRFTMIFVRLILS